MALTQGFVAAWPEYVMASHRIRDTGQAASAASFGAQGVVFVTMPGIIVRPGLR